MGQKWVKNVFSENYPGPFMMLKQVVLAHFEPVATGFGSWKIPKCLENGPFWDQKCVKNGSKTRFSKSDPGPFGMLKQVFLARFEPVLTEFSPFHHMCAPLCALRTYLRTVWWSHLELGEGCRLEDRYVRKTERGAYPWWKGLSSIKTCSKWAQNTCLGIPNGPGSLLEKCVFDPFLTNFVPKRPTFKLFWDFPWPKMRPYGLKMG